MKKVLISGGSRGIGAACVEKFRSEGDRVIFLYRNSDDAARSLCKKSGAECLRCDVSDPAQAVSAFETAVKMMGGLDTLVCCAGVSLIAQICDTSDIDWRRITDTNLTSVFTLCREASKVMAASHSGSIINIGSIWGAVGASCECAYSASKAGVRGLTAALAKELAPSGVTVNCVEPGVIDTDMNACFSDSEKRTLAEEIPIGRFGQAWEVARLVHFLSTDGARYITAQCIGVDGGFGR